MIDPELLHPAGIGVEDFEFERAGPGHELAAHRHAADPRRHVSGESVHFLGGVADVEFTDDRRDVLEARTGVGEKRAVGLAHHAWRHVLVVLVRDLADDLLDDVLDRYDAVSAAIFIDDEGKMHAGRLHLGEQIEHRHGRRSIEDFADDFRGRQRHRQIDGFEVEAGRKRLFAAPIGGCAQAGAHRHERD